MTPNPSLPAAPVEAVVPSDERQAFEQWAHSMNYDTHRDGTEKYQAYHRATTRFAREGWLSALAWAKNTGLLSRDAGESLMALAVIRELTGTQQQDLDATIDAVTALAAPPAVLVEPAKGDRVRTADGYQGTVTAISPPNKRFHVHIHKGQGDVYHANELTVLAAPAVPLEQPAGQNVHLTTTSTKFPDAAVVEFDESAGEAPDIADIIAGTLQTSRAHAYELMRRALRDMEV